MNFDMWLERRFGNATYSWPEFEGFCRTHRPRLITAEPRLGRREFYVRFRTQSAENKIDIFFDKMYGERFGDYPDVLVAEEKQDQRRKVLLETYHSLTELQREISVTSGKTEIEIIQPGRQIIDGIRFLDLYLIEEYVDECIHGPAGLSPYMKARFL